jgi:hypothetical protein
MSRRPAPPPKRYADNVQDRLVSLNELLLAPGTYLRGDNAPGKMDYVQSRKRAAPIPPVVNRGGNTGQEVTMGRAKRKPAKSLAADGQSDNNPAKELYAVRRDLHNRLGRLDRMEAQLATMRQAISELEVRERLLTYLVWEESPSRLAEINESTRRWRRRKSDT